MRATTIVVAVLAATALVAATASAAAVERRALEGGRSLPVADGWKLVGDAPADEVIRMTFAVKQRNVDVLERELMAVSDPDSPRYGQHLSFEQVNSLVAPATQAVETVTAFLTSHGVPTADIETSPNSDFLTVAVPVATAERMLDTKYHEYHHASGATALRTTHGYTVPVSVHEHLDFVTPTLRLPAVRKSLIRKQQPEGSLINDPDWLRQLYNTKNYSATNPATTQAVASFLEQYEAPTDLAEFFKLFAPALENNTHIGPIIVGPNSGMAGTEASLDIQYIMGVGAGVKTWFYSTPGRNPGSPDNEPFLVWLQNVSATSSPPALFSISYGEDEKSVGFDYAVRVNTEFMKNGARGISFLAAAGDSGVGGNCSKAGRFSPNFPCGSPYVTAVGGLVGGDATQPTGERVDSIGGGGISDWWDRPEWQKAAVAKYLSNSSILPPAKNFNHTGRAYPDIAAQSELFVVVQFGIPLPGVGGTSCASPTAGGIISLLNDVRLNAGKTNLGFLNPMLYKAAAAGTTGANEPFSDVVSGANEGCGFGDTGFKATVGWDPASGLGSLNFEGLKQTVLDLP